MAELKGLATPEEMRNIAVEKLVAFCNKVESNKGKFDRTEFAKLEVMILRTQNMEGVKDVLSVLPSQYTYAKGVCADLVGMALSGYSAEKKDQMADQIQKRENFAPYEAATDDNIM